MLYIYQRKGGGAYSRGGMGEVYKKYLLRSGVSCSVKSVGKDPSAEDPYILSVPLGSISHVEKMGRSRNKGEHSYGLEIYCKVS